MAIRIESLVPTTRDWVLIAPNAHSGAMLFLNLALALLELQSLIAPAFPQRRILTLNTPLNCGLATINRVRNCGSNGLGW